MALFLVAVAVVLMLLIGGAYLLGAVEDHEWRHDELDTNGVTPQRYNEWFREEDRRLQYLAEEACRPTTTDRIS